MKRILAILLLAAQLAVIAPICSAAGLTEEDREALTAFAACCPEDQFAARVAFAAVVLNRLDAEGCEDSIPEAIRQLCGELGLRTSDISDEKLLRVSSDAARSAEAGADPTEGALFIRLVRGAGGFDLRFDDSREEKARKIREAAFAGCGTVIGCVGFYGSALKNDEAESER